MSIFEIIMLVCFGASWPFSLYKTWQSKSSTGKSQVFLWLVFIGYLSGIIHKVLYNRDWVIILYALNSLMVLADLLLCLHFNRVTRNTAAQPRR
ncbi:MAG TPA: hypothetical protein VGL77_14795 [Armatimonadota bacterium]